MFTFIKRISEKYFSIFLIGAIVLTVVVGSLWQKSKSEKLSSDTDAMDDSINESPLVILDDDQKEKIPAVSEEDHIRGKAGTPITLIVYSDFECPYCKEYHSTLLQILAEYEEGVGVIYRHYPIADTHPASPFLAEASECANELGGSAAFWKFADEVFENKERFGNLEYAADILDVNGEELEGCLKSRRYKDKVQASYDAGVKAGIRVTPSTFVMNDKGEAWFIPGAYSFEDLKVVIEDSLN